MQAYLPIALLAVLGVAITGAMFNKMNGWERLRVENAFRDGANDRILVVKREIEYTLGVVEDIGSIFSANDRVRRREFRTFVRPALERRRNIRALEWIPRVERAERDRFVADARKSFSRFQIKERGADGTLSTAAPRAEHFPILYVQPYQHNKQALGLDLASSPALMDRILSALESGLMRDSPYVVMARDGAPAPHGFEAWLPVFHDHSGEEASVESDEDMLPIEPHRGHLHGFARGIFNLRETIERALQDLSPGGINIQVYDSADTDVRRLLYKHRSRLPVLPPGTLPTASAIPREDLRVSGILEVGQQRWQLRCTPVAGAYVVDPFPAQVVLMSGLAFTLLLTVYLSAQVDRATKIQRLVSDRTEQLQASNAALNKEASERRQAQADLQALNETLEQRVEWRTRESERRAEELEQFVYVASHDLKAPLRSVANLAGWLQEDLAEKLSPETGEQMKLLQDRVDRMHALIEGLLDYSRVGGSESLDEEVNCAELLAEIIDSLAPPSGFQVHLPPAPPVLHTSRLHLSQVLTNLIGNAINHNPGDSGNVWISMRDQAGHLEIEVADDGPGIAPEYHEKIFKMFQVLSTRDYGRDTGIGLAIVRKIVLEHGGSIVLDSQEGQGARFRFTWPKQVTGRSD